VIVSEACRGWAVGDRDAGPGAAAVGTFLAVAGPDGVDHPAVQKGVKGTPRRGSKSLRAWESASAPEARASSHQSPADQRGGTLHVRTRIQHRAHSTGHAVGLREDAAEPPSSPDPGLHGPYRWLRMAGVARALMAAYPLTRKQRFGGSTPRKVKNDLAQDEYPNQASSIVISDEEYPRLGFRRFAECTTAIALNVEEHTVTQAERQKNGIALLRQFCDKGVVIPGLVQDHLTPIVPIQGIIPHPTDRVARFEECRHQMQRRSAWK
jgi:hypothetical protein